MRQTTNFASLLLLIVQLATQTPASAEGEGFTQTDIDFFESKVRPVLAKHCYECHSDKAKTLQGGLRLDSRAGALKGGDSGAAVLPGKPNKSLLIQSIRWKSFEMPPQEKLSAGDVASLVKWVELGVPWPDEAANLPQVSPQAYDWDKLRQRHWAFRPVRMAALPQVENGQWPQNEVDRFVLAKLERSGLSPAPPAQPHVLIRRIYLDLIGLPPTPEEVVAFVQALQRDRGTAIRLVIDHLLDSPHYGERWGRHWLDVARYSDGYGGFLDKAGYPDAWRYRDWVVAAFNDDLPFHEFVKLQIAGDILDKREAAVATGFFALGPTYRSDGGDPDSVAQAKGETLDDRVDTLSRGLLGLTVSCARCHDHKFDPIPQQDYYSLAGVFNNTRIHQQMVGPAEEIKAFNEAQKAIKDLQNKLNKRQNEIKKQKRQPNADEQTRLDAWTKELEQFKKQAPPQPEKVHALTESGSGNMKVAIRGNLRKPGEVAPKRFLRILAGESPTEFTKGSGRLELAAAVTDPDNPLTARVFVNRVWMHHFGKALVRSPSNFGALGERPTHPQLLDWLAAEFIQSGWSVKQLHRTIMLSATYQMSSRFDDRGFCEDGDNRLIWRMNPRRLDAEAWRDSLLAVTGELDPALGGPPTNNLQSRRRTLYFKVSRNGDQFASDVFLRLFDFPLMRATVAKRPTSIVPQQYLFMMNSSFMQQRARALAAKLNEQFASETQRIEAAYELLFGRLPTDSEAKL